MIDEHFTRESVDGIPVVHIVPSAANDRRRLALFLPFLGGTKERFDVSTDDIAAGGVSMGGDIAVALAAVDHRVTRVGAVVATPDWTRPGMTRVGEPDAVIDQGAATPYGT